MEKRNFSIISAGMSSEKIDELTGIFSQEVSGIFVLTSVKSIEETSGFDKAECLLVDYSIWSRDDFALKKILSGSNETGIPVIFIGNSNSDNIAESFRKGADEYLDYPFRGAEVIARIKNQIELKGAKRFLEKEVSRRTDDLIDINKKLNESIEEYKKILKDLQENETLFLTIALNIPNSYLAIIEKNYTISFAAGQEFKKNKLDPWRLIGMPLKKLFKEQADLVLDNLEKTFGGKETSFELEFNNQYLLYKAVPLFNGVGEVQRILAVAENISEQKAAELRIKESLREKETLLKEIHHRVKNNMQLVCSMISLQADCISNPDVFEILKILQNRIYSMSLVHEKLYHHKQFSQINFRDYIEELVAEIRNSFSGDRSGSDARIILDLRDENFTIEKAIPCGLILNELILNAFKHASLSPSDGIIRIVFKKNSDNCFCLTVSDNGKGLPEGFDILKSDSMGMLLVRELVGQLKGKISVESGIETAFTVIFGENITDPLDLKISEPASGGKNILIVEDERIISRMIRKIIEESGYTIIDAVSSGRDAIKSADMNNPDLIIMDIMLEDDIDGVQAAVAILQNHKCPIVFLTGNSDPATLKSARDINPYQMLTKPVEKYRLVQVIKSALE